MSGAPHPESAEAAVRPIIEWLSAVQGEAAPENVATLRSHLLTLRQAGLPPERHLQLLGFIYDHSIKVVSTILPSLHDIALPVSRKMRQQIRGVQDLLEGLALDYLSSFVLLCDPTHEKPAHTPEVSIWRAVHCLRTHLLISDLFTAPAGVGIWQKLHGAYLTAQRYGLADQRLPRQELTLEQVYLTALLLSCSQPASFSSRELEFIADYIGRGADLIVLSKEAPQGQALFWIDQGKDAPAHPLARRMPPPETSIVYFSCDGMAQLALDHLKSLESGYPAHQLDLPDFAQTPAGHGVLRRLVARWGKPAKRRFSRRRQSYRVSLCAGLDNIWHLLSQPEETPANTSEWMTTNESPDGSAVMHVSGATDHLHIGDLVAIRAEAKPDAPPPPWNICMVRWALSENPEHIELGLQILAPTALPAQLAIKPSVPDAAQQAAALFLPGLPPLRPEEALVVSTGTLAEHPGKFTIFLDQDKIHLREMHATGINEQTSNIEIFSVEADEQP